MVSPILPLYVIELGASYTLLGVIISVYGGVQLLTQIPCGRLSDRVGRKPLMLTGIMIFAFLAPLYVRANDPYSVLLLRIFCGLGSSMVWPVAMALVIDLAGRGRRGRVMGWYNATFYTALAVGPAIGGLFLDIGGIGAPFYIWSLLALVSALIVLTQVDDSPLQRAISRSEGDVPKSDLIQKEFLATFAACSGAVMQAGLLFGFIMTLLPSYARDQGFSGAEIGLLYFFFSGVTAVSNVYFGRASDRGGRRALIFTGSALAALSFFAINLTSGASALMATMSLLGLGLGMSNPAASAVIADVANPHRRGEIFGTFNTARMAGSVLGALAAGLAADAYGIKGAILIFAALTLLIAAGTLAVRDPRSWAESDICSKTRMN